MSVNLIFSENEYQQRVRKTKDMMDKSGMEMLLVMDPANMNYLTGYDGWSFYVHQGVIVAWMRIIPCGSAGSRIPTGPG